MQSPAKLRPAVDLDTYFTDPGHVDPKFPPHFTQFSVDSGGSNVPVKMWMAGGQGTKGTVIISPPLGGSETMNSVIVPLMYAGIHVMNFRPRGVRDPKNVYSMPKSVDDEHAIIDWIVANSGADKKAPFGPTLRLDPTRIALFGMSGGGGNNSYAVCAESKYANYAISCAAGNVDYQLTPEMHEKMRPLYEAVKEATRGRSDWESWLFSMTPAEKDRVSIIQNAPKLVSKHLLMMGAAHDAVSPIEITQRPNAKALREAGVKDLTELIFETDHGFMTKRYSLPRVMIAWLRSHGF